MTYVEVMLFLIESRSESSFSTEKLCRQVGPGVPGLAYAQASDRNRPYKSGGTPGAPPPIITEALIPGFNGSLR
jgi:hypothetical protein